jgi:hypothetical protein
LSAVEATWAFSIVIAIGVLAWFVNERYGKKK